jgi:probable HAF family extracellular repeat protein
LYSHARLAELIVPLLNIPSSTTAWSDLLSFRPASATQLYLYDRGGRACWRPLRIENGSGVVNLDFYAVHVTALPAGWTEEDLFDRFRNNFLEFVEHERAEFLAYDEDLDASTWRSADPSNSVFRFRLKYQGIPVEGGSVIVSHWDQFTWRFSTVYTSLDWKHPVSGTREFGLFRSDEGQLYIYTRAADRPTGLWDSIVTQALPAKVNQLLASLGFETLSDFFPTVLNQGDAIWRSFQKRVRDFIIDANGKADVVEAVVFRPQWDELSDIYRPTTAWIKDYLVLPWQGPGSEEIRPVCIWDDGTLLGNQIAPDGSFKGAVWRPTSGNFLPESSETSVLEGQDKGGEVTGIGSDGSIVGFLGNRYEQTVGAIWSPTGQLHEVSVPGALSTRFDTLITEQKYAGTARFPLHAATNQTSIDRVFIMDEEQSSTFLDGLVPERSCECIGSNAGGAIIGTSIDSAERVRAVIWQGGSVSDLGALPGGEGVITPFSINQHGTIVGQANVPGAAHAFAWRKGKMNDLGTLGGKRSSANCINEGGQIVGSATTSTKDMHAAIWQNDQISDLNQLSDNLEWNLQYAISINRFGAILGGGLFKGKSDCFVMYPLL